jgi:hypothetical protein
MEISKMMDRFWPNQEQARGGMEAGIVMFIAE